MYENDYTGMGEFLLTIAVIASTGALLLSLLPFRRTRRALAKAWLGAPVLAGFATWFVLEVYGQNLEPSSPILIAAFTVLFLLVLWSTPALGIYATGRLAINLLGRRRKT